MVVRLIMIAVCFLLTGMQVNFFVTYSSPSFRIRYEKNVPKTDVKKLADSLESKLALYQRRFGISSDHKIDVYVYNSNLRFHSDAGPTLFEDGNYHDGNIYVLSPGKLQREAKLSSTLDRVIARVVLMEVNLCPPWLADCYSLYLGNNLTQFGQPAQFKIASFSDLSEEYAAADHAKELKEVYAKLAVTANFLVSRYGEKKTESMFSLFQNTTTVEEAFESAFGEKITDIEKAWVIALQRPIKE